MEPVFTGIYYDGNSSRPNPAQVILEPGQVRITYQVPDQPVPVTVYWQPSRIQSELFTDQHLTSWSYGAHPAQRLEITHPNFKDALEKQYRQTHLLQPPTVLPVGKVRAWFWMAATVLLVLAVSFYIWGLPRLADRVAQVIPQSTDEYLGKQLYQQVLSTAKVEPELTRNVHGFLRQLRLKSTYRLRLTVINENNPNAFALPGGYMIVHHSILNRLQQPEELAALLGHEIGHVQNRHTTRALFRSLASYLFISLIFGDVSGITSVVVQNADVLKSLEYSRKLEQEADRFGFEILRQNHINPRGMILLFQRLKQEERKSPGNSAPEEFLSTHPPLDSRITHIREIIKKQPYEIQPSDSLQYYWHKIKQQQQL